MGRFGIRNYESGWNASVEGVRPLLRDDAARTTTTIGAIAATACLPVDANPWLGVAALLPPAVVVLCARVPVQLVGARLLAVLPFGIFTVMFLPWVGEGPREPFYGISYRPEGLRLAGSASVKLLSAALWLSYLSATTPAFRLLAALHQLRVPGMVVDILGSTLSYLALLAGECRQMLLSCRLRGTGNASRKTVTGRFSRLASLVAGLFLRTLKRGERCQTARASRELGGGEGPLENSGEGVAGKGMGEEILIEGLSYTYPGAEDCALRGVTLSIPRGRRIAILGANGAGKTTLLLHCNGGLQAQSGRIAVGGRLVERGTLSAIRRRVGMVFQNPDDQVFAPTVGEDVAYGPEQAGDDVGEVDRKCEEALRAVGLWSKRDRAPFSLSQGERKRAAIAGVLAAGAETLLFDEPMASLDPAGKDELQVILNDLHAEGRTLVAATHDVDFAAGWADGVVLMESGQVVAAGAVSLLADESAMSVAGLALPQVSRPFELLRPHLKGGGMQMGRLPVNVEEAYAWLREQFSGRRERHDRQRERTAPETGVDRSADTGQLSGRSADGRARLAGPSEPDGAGGARGGVGPVGRV